MELQLGTSIAKLCESLKSSVTGFCTAIGLFSFHLGSHKCLSNLAASDRFEVFYRRFSCDHVMSKPRTS